MRQELGRGPAFLRGEGRDSREEIVIGKFSRESDEVRVQHASVYHGEFRGSDEALPGARSVARRAVLRE